MPSIGCPLSVVQSAELNREVYHGFWYHFGLFVVFRKLCTIIEILIFSKYFSFVQCISCQVERAWTSSHIPKLDRAFTELQRAWTGVLSWPPDTTTLLPYCQGATALFYLFQIIPVVPVPTAMCTGKKALRFSYRYVGLMKIIWLDEAIW